MTFQQQPCYSATQSAQFLAPNYPNINYDMFLHQQAQIAAAASNGSSLYSGQNYYNNDMSSQNATDSFVNQAMFPLIQAQQPQPNTVLPNQCYGYPYSHMGNNYQMPAAQQAPFAGNSLFPFQFYQQLDPTSLTLCKAIEKTSKMLQYSRNKDNFDGNRSRKRRECNKTHTTLKISNLGTTYPITEDWLLSHILPIPIQPIGIRMHQGEDLVFIEFASVDDCHNSALFIKSKFPNVIIEFEMSTEKDLTNVYITNLPSTDDYDKETLEKMFSEFGQVQSCKLIDLNHNSGRIGFVRFQRRSEAAYAIQEIKRRQLILMSDSKPIECKYANKNARNSSSNSITLNSPSGTSNGYNVVENDVNSLPMSSVAQSSPLMINSHNPSQTRFQPDMNNNISRYIFQNVQ